MAGNQKEESMVPTMLGMSMTKPKIPFPPTPNHLNFPTSERVRRRNRAVPVPPNRHCESAYADADVAATGRFAADV